MVGKICALAFVSVSLAASVLAAKPQIDTSNERVKTSVSFPYAKLGVLTPKDVSQTKNNITVGCETLDRDYADYEQYKEYLSPLGIKKSGFKAAGRKPKRKRASTTSRGSTKLSTTQEPEA